MSDQQPPVPQPQAPLPTGVTQKTIDAAITHVERTGNTDGISPDVLQAACQQLQAQAHAKGVQLEPGTPSQDDGSPNSVEAAVMDKKGALEAFHQQRDSLKDAVAQQLKAAQAPYREALQKAHGKNVAPPAGAGDETMVQLINALKKLDPKTIELLNVVGMIQADPSILNTIVWLEIIHAMQNRSDPGVEDR